MAEQKLRYKNKGKQKWSVKFSKSQRCNRVELDSCVGLLEILINKARSETLK